MGCQLRLHDEDRGLRHRALDPERRLHSRRVGRGPHREEGLCIEDEPRGEERRGRPDGERHPCSACQSLTPDGCRERHTQE